MASSKTHLQHDFRYVLTLPNLKIIKGRKMKHHYLNKYEPKDGPLHSVFTLYSDVQFSGGEEEEKCAHLWLVLYI